MYMTLFSLVRYFGIIKHTIQSDFRVRGWNKIPYPIE